MKKLDQLVEYAKIGLAHNGSPAHFAVEWADAVNSMGDLRDMIAVSALRGLMLRYDEQGYTDRDAVNEAYNIADLMIERRKNE